MLTYRSMRRVMALLLIASLQIVAAGAGEKAASDRPLPIEESLAALTLAFRTPTDLSPDGKWIAYTLIDPRQGRSVDEEERSRFFTETGAPGGVVGCDVWVTNT